MLRHKHKHLFDIEQDEKVSWQIVIHENMKRTL